jgi:hypothetical protein
MKTLKLVLIAIILSVGITSMPAQGQPKAYKVINMSLQNAIQDPGLLIAMHAQLTIDFIKVDKPGLYYAYVSYNKNIYRIYGPHREWVWFFQIKPATIVVKTIIHH